MGGAGSPCGNSRRPGPLDRAVILAETWSGGERSWRETRDPIGNTGLEESTGGIWHEDTSGHELFELGHGRAVEEGTRRNPIQSRRFQDLLGGVLRGVLVNG